MLELWVEGVSHGAGVCACDYPLISCTTNQKNEPQLIDAHQGTRCATIVWRGPTLAKITITSRSQHQREHGAKRLLEGTRPPALTTAMLSTKGLSKMSFPTRFCSSGSRILVVSTPQVVGVGFRGISCRSWAPRFEATEKATTSLWKLFCSQRSLCKHNFAMSFRLLRSGGRVCSAGTHGDAFRVSIQALHAQDRKSVV